MEVADEARRPRVLLVVASLALTAGYCAYLGFPAVFTGSAAYDDEGYVLASFRSYVASGDLYSTTYSQYGPGYYALFGTLFRVLGVDLLSLTPGRVTALVLLVGTSTAGATAVWLASKRVLPALAAQLFLFVFLRTSVGEPLHPGGFLVFLLALASVTCFVSRGRWPLVAPVAMGTILALMVTTKVNVGGFAIAGCALAVASAHSSRLIRTAACVLFVGLPVALMAPDLNDPPVRAFALVVILGAVVAHVAIAAGPERSIDRKTVVAFALPGVIVSVLACATVMLSGTSPAELLEGAIIDPTRMRRSVSIAFPLDLELASMLVLPALVLVGAALISRLLVAEPHVSRLVGVLKLVGGTVAIAALSRNALDAFPQVIVLTALCAVPLRRYSDDGLLARRILVAIAVLQPLHAYPVAGNQWVWGEFLLVLVSFINVADGLSEVAGIFDSVPEGVRRLSWIPSVLAVWLIAVIAVGHNLSPASAYREYDRLPPLELPGAGSVRIGADQAAAYTSIVLLLRSNCDSFYSLPGMNSFHVFAQMPPATGRNVGPWAGVFTDATQKATVEDLSAFRGRLCILRNDVQLAFWQGGRPLRPGPLVEFVEEFSQEIGRVGDYVLLRRPASDSG